MLRENLDWDDVVNGKLKPIIIPSEGTSYISRDIRKLPVISTTEEGEDVETRGRERSINSTEFEGYSFEGMSGAPNKSGDVSIFEAAQKAAVGKGDRNLKLEVANNSV